MQPFRQRGNLAAAPQWLAHRVLGATPVAGRLRYLPAQATQEALCKLKRVFLKV